MAHLGFGHVSPARRGPLRAYAPDLDRYGYVSPHSVVELVVEDMPFLVDSMTMELTRHGCGLHLVVHPVITVRRDANGALVEVLPARRRSTTVKRKPTIPPGLTRESFMHIEIDRETDPRVARGAAGRAHGCRRRRDGGGAGLAGDAGPGANKISDELAAVRLRERSRRRCTHWPTASEVAALLRWLSDGHFSSSATGSTSSGTSPAKSCCGTWRHRARHPAPGRAVDRSVTPSPSCRRRSAARALEPNLLNMTKASSRSTVHRRSYLDYIGVKGCDAKGERRVRAALPRAVHDERLQAVARPRSRSCAARWQRSWSGPATRPTATAARR